MVLQEPPRTAWGKGGGGGLPGLGSVPPSLPAHAGSPCPSPPASRLGEHLPGTPAPAPARDNPERARGGWGLPWDGERGQEGAGARQAALAAGGCEFTAAGAGGWMVVPMV